MSVITARALPDVRDGLKPVHRRILWGMLDIGARPDRSWMKCARVTGDVMGNYHPHGDGAIYDALVRMAQDFSLRHPLVAGHGNFGSPDFGPAASRYTECRLAPLAMRDARTDIDEDTVDFVDNYSGEFQRARRPAGPLPQPAGQRQPGHRRRHGHQHPAPQPGRGHRRRRPPDRQPRGHARRPHAVRQGARLPDGRADHGPRRHHRRLPHRQGLDPAAGPRRDRRGHGPPARPHRRHRDALPDLDRRPPRSRSRSWSRPARSRASPTSTTSRRAARPGWSSSSRRTRRRSSSSTTSTSTRRCRRTSPSTRWRWSTACPARSTSSRCCRPTSTTRSRSSAGAASSGCDKAQGAGPHRRGPAQGHRHDRRDHRPHPGAPRTGPRPAPG